MFSSIHFSHTNFDSVFRGEGVIQPNGAYLLSRASSEWLVRRIRPCLMFIHISFPLRLSWVWRILTFYLAFLYFDFTFFSLERKTSKVSIFFQSSRSKTGNHLEIRFGKRTIKPPVYRIERILRGTEVLTFKFGWAISVFRPHQTRNTSILRGNNDGLS